MEEKGIWLACSGLKTNWGEMGRGQLAAGGGGRAGGSGDISS